MPNWAATERLAGCVTKPVDNGYFNRLEWREGITMTMRSALPWRRRAAVAACIGFLSLCSSAVGAVDAHAKETIRVGHFPNITHVQALVARALERQGKNFFAERLPGVLIEWYAYNAGPSAMEAIFANSVDLTYVGPSPAINAYARANGDAVRVIAGAVDGGSSLVVQGDSQLRG